MKKVLVLEDDKITQKLIEVSLKFDYELIQCETISQATKEIEENPEISLCILDRYLPDGDGIDICKSIRSREDLQNLPIIFLSGVDSESEKILGLMSGADDYVTKPFSTMELKARIAARLRLHQKKLFTSDFEINIESGQIHRRNRSKESIEFTSIEFRMLICFLNNKERILSRQQVLDKVWGVGKFYSDRLIDTHICNLRKKLGICQLELKSIRGSGYMLSELVKQAVPS